MYYVVYGFLWLISLLPLKLLYVLSDCIYGLMFYVFKYRKAVVMSNLSIAFPEKTEGERKKIAKKFYHNLVDMFIETIKMISSSQKFLDKRVAANWETINALTSSGKSVQMHMGHNFNWEWGSVVAARKVDLPILVVYMPIGNKIFEKLFCRLRSRSGNKLLRATRMADDFLPYHKTQYLMGLVADQNPGHPANAWWFEFFGKPTPFVKGPAKAAIANKTEVVFTYIHKLARGRYEALITVVENAAGLTEIELTKKFVRYLEDVIRQFPEMWLWSHRRWKWEWKPEYGEINK